MATRRRQPQALPQAPLTQVTAAPVSTFVDPGQGGAPAQPVLAPAPTPPAQNQYQDLNNLAQAFGGLSQSLADIGRAQLAEQQQAFRQQQFDKQNQKEREADSRRRAAAIKEREREARRLKDRAEMLERSKKADERAAAADLRRQVAFIEEQIKDSVLYSPDTNPAEYMQQVGSQLTTLHEQGLINLDELPLRRAASSFAAVEAVRETKESFQKELSDALEKDPKLSTLEGFLSFYNDYTESLKQDLSKYPDPGAAAASIDTARNRQLQYFKGLWNRTTSERLQTQQKSEVKETVLSLIDNAYEAWDNASKAQIRAFSYATRTFDVEDTPDETTVFKRRRRIFEAKAEELASAIDTVIKTGTMSASSLNQLVGKEIIDRLPQNGEPDFNKAKFIRQFLDYAKVGPEGNRAPLLGDGKGVTYTYYKDNEAAWEDRKLREANSEQRLAEEAAKAAYITRREDYIDNTLGDYVGGLVKQGNYTATTIRDRLQQTAEDAAGVTYEIRGGGNETYLVFPGEHGATEKKVKLTSIIQNALANEYQAISQNESQSIRASISKGLPTYQWIAQNRSPEDQQYAIDILGKGRAAALLPGHLDGDDALFDFFAKTITEQNTNPKQAVKNMANLELAIQVMDEFAQKDSNNVFTKRVLGKHYDLMKTVHALAKSDEPILRAYGSITQLQSQMSKESFADPAALQEAREANNTSIEKAVVNLLPKIQTFSNPNEVSRLLVERLHIYANLTGYDSLNVRQREQLQRAAEAFLNTIGNDSVQVGEISLYNTDVPKEMLDGLDSRLAVKPEEAEKVSLFGTPYPDRLNMSGMLTRAQEYIRNSVFPPSYAIDIDPKAEALVKEIRRDTTLSGGTYFEPIPGSSGEKYFLHYKGNLGQYFPSGRVFDLEEVMTLAKAQPSRQELADRVARRKQQSTGYAIRVSSELRSFQDQEGPGFGMVTEKEKIYADTISAFNTEGIKDEKTVKRIEQLKSFYIQNLKQIGEGVDPSSDLQRVGERLLKWESMAERINPKSRVVEKTQKAVEETVKKIVGGKE